MIDVDKLIHDIGNTIGTVIDEVADMTEVARSVKKDVTSKVNSFKENVEKERSVGSTESAARAAGQHTSEHAAFTIDEKQCINCGKPFSIFSQKKRIADGYLCKTCYGKFLRIQKKYHCDLPKVIFEDLKEMEREEDEHRAYVSSIVLKTVFVLAIASVLLFSGFGILGSDNHTRHGGLEQGQKNGLLISETAEDTLELSQKILFLEKGASEVLTVENATGNCVWACENERVATVNNDGEVTAASSISKDNAQTIVYATDEEGNTGICLVIVR